MPVDDFYILI